MTDEQVPAPSEAGHEAVQPAETAAPEAAKSTEGQVQTPPADGEGEEPKPEESPSKARRERRKAEVARLRQENAELRKQLDAKETAPRGQEAASPPPKQEDFASYEEWQAEFTAYKAMERMDAREAARAKREADELRQKLDEGETRRKQELAMNWRDQVADARTRYTDFDQVFGPDLPVTVETAEMLQESDHGADIAYWLGTHRAEAARIASLSPLEQAREIGRLEATVSAPRPQQITSAPEPIAPVRARASGTKDAAKMTMDEYRAARESGKL